MSGMVPMPCPSRIVALTAPERLTKKVSLGSLSRSSMMGTLKVCVVTPGAKVRSVGPVAV